jgi:hypothetical protein
MTVRPYRLAAASIALCLGLVAAPARAAFVTVTLDSPSQSVTVPTSGNITLNYTGTVTIAQGATFSSTTLTPAFDAANDELIPTFSGINLAPASNGGSVSGLLFTVTINSTTAPGFYNLNPTSSFPEFGVTAAIATGGTNFVGESYTVTVNARPVPEPSTLALTACGAGLAALGLRHRRSRRCR